MLKKLSISVFMLIMVLLLTVTTAFGATNSNGSSYMDSSGNISIEGASVPNTEFAFSGSNITANSVFDSTTFFAGNAITLNGEYNGDVFVAGNTVTINGKINGNLYGGANQIIINGEVGKDIFIGCSDLTISKTGKIDRDAFLAAANVNIDGLVERNLRAGSGNLNINGTINGMVDADVDQLTINDGAKITGAINNRSANQAIVSPSATVPTINWEKVVEDQTVKEEQGPSVGSILLSIITKLAFILVVWLLISFLTRDFNANSSVLAKKHIPASLGIGAAFFFLAPLLLIVSFVIYVPMGFAMTCLMIMLSIVGMPVAAVVLSKLLMRFFDEKMKPLLSSFVSVLIVSAAVIILGFIPIIGFIVGLFMAVVGVGFICYNILFTHRKLEMERNSEDSLMIQESIQVNEANMEMNETVELLAEVTNSDEVTSGDEEQKK